tara:strand:- start:250 stop:582 length:333 start_codon:yes stop_codon:yes gene_type:complete
MDITLIAIVIFILAAVVFLILFLFKSGAKKSFRADDGSIFESQSDLDKYQELLEKTKSLFSENIEDTPASQLLGFQNSFLTKLTKEGFTDLKTIVKYRKQFQSFSDLINS